MHHTKAYLEDWNDFDIITCGPHSYLESEYDDCFLTRFFVFGTGRPYPGYLGFDFDE